MYVSAGDHRVYVVDRLQTTPAPTAGTTSGGSNSKIFAPGSHYCPDCSENLTGYGDLSYCPECGADLD